MVEAMIEPDAKATMGEMMGRGRIFLVRNWITSNQSTHSMVRLITSNGTEMPAGPSCTKNVVCKVLTTSTLGIVFSYIQDESHSKSFVIQHHRVISL
eukprot:scaffold622_cov102-Cylindrotheca_fusiformis.AAC.4